MNEHDIIMDDESLFFKCPQCDEYIQVYIKDIYCGIFRHAIFKSNYQQVNPHLPKKDCDQLYDNDEIYGCCKPFQLKKMNNTWIPIICDYI